MHSLHAIFPYHFLNSTLLSGNPIPFQLHLKRKFLSKILSKASIMRFLLPVLIIIRQTVLTLHVATPRTFLCKHIVSFGIVPSIYTNFYSITSAFNSKRYFSRLSVFPLYINISLESNGSLNADHFTASFWSLIDSQLSATVSVFVDLNFMMQLSFVINQQFFSLFCKIKIFSDTNRRNLSFGADCRILYRVAFL